MKVLENNVFVKQIESEDKKTESGIIVRTVDQKRWDAYKYGYVRYVGPGFKDKNGEYVPLEVNVGDKIMYPRNEYDIKLDIDGEKLLVIKESEIMLVLGTEEEDNNEQ